MLGGWSYAEMGRSGPRGLIDRNGILTLTVTGRKSGREIPRPVQFVLQDDSIFLIPFMGKTTIWYVNVMSNPRVKITKGEIKFTAEAEILDEKGVKEAVELFIKAYGKRMMESRYPKKDAAVRILMPDEERASFR
jgi:deazaflavin-dependent oxidoreductase (nitroreductase family)